MPLQRKNTAFLLSLYHILFIKKENERHKKTKIVMLIDAETNKKINFA